MIPQIMQGFVVGYVGRRVSDKTTLIASVVMVALSYLVLVSGCGLGGRGSCESFCSTDDDIDTPPAVSGFHSNDNGRGSPQHTHQQCHHQGVYLF